MLATACVRAPAPEGRRLRAAIVSFEDHQDLLGHRSGRITTHHSQAELASLIAAAEQVCATESRKSPRNHLASPRSWRKERRQVIDGKGRDVVPQESLELPTP